MTESSRVLLTGATGFLGSRLLPELEEDGVEVICASRNVERARRSLGDRALRSMDVLDAPSVRDAMRGCTAAYYLIHSMRDGEDYETVEQRSAHNFARAAAEEGLRRIVYLGGVQPAEGTPSRHLESRRRTGEILRSGEVPTIELRAAMIVGGGSESFRIVRDLAARLPWMLLPRWLDSKSEPVAVRDVTRALRHALRVELESSACFDIPGPEVLSGREMILRTSRLLGIQPRTYGVPVVTPKLSTYWLRLVTRADPHVAAQLVEGLRHDLIHEEPCFWNHLPGYERASFEHAAEAALAEEEKTVSEGVRHTEAWLRSLFSTTVDRNGRTKARS